MTIDKLPSGPSRTDTANFAARADALLAALPRFIDQVNALELANLIQGTEATAARDAAIAAWAASTAPAEQLAAISQTIHSGAIVKAIVYDTSKDSDGGAWRKRCQHTSWYQEALGFTGKWLSQKANLAAAWATSGAAAGDGYQNVADGKFYTLTGTNTHSEIWRGNVREHPAVVLEVLDSAGRFIIYDLTQPTTCPMWMVTTVGGTSVACVNGTVFMGSASGVYEYQFAADQIYLRYRVSGSNLLKTSFPGRNTAYPVVGIVGATAIVNQTVNDVAITVLDTAPRDDATVLPVPTIAVATAGGVSVIKNDGTVVNSASTASATLLSISGATVWLKAQASNHLSYFSLDGISAGFSMSSVASPWTAWPLGGTSSGAFNSSRQYAYNGSNGGLSVLLHNPSTPAKGMVAYITNTSNSGNLVGDIRGAHLADTTAETISGSGELVTNGTFATDTSGWTAGSGAVLSVDTQRLKITNGTATNGYASFPITTVVGRSYTVTIEAAAGTADCGVGIGTDPATSNTVGWAAGSRSVTFIASATTLYVRVIVSTATSGHYAFADNISVKLAEPDRCVKNKGLIVNGSLTKTAVASAAALVAWSGFSASNNLWQPPNTDLDFGTGDFYAMGWAVINSTATQFFFDRATAGAGRIALYQSGGSLSFSVSATAATSTPSINILNGLHHFVMVRTSGVLDLYMDNVKVHTVANTANVTNTAAPLTLGIGYDLTSGPMLGSMALWRFGATAPSADQIAHIYRTELALFQPGAQCTLAGSSAAVTTMAYDEDTTLLHVGTSWGRSSFKDLARIDSEATTTGALTSLSASGGVIVTGGTSGKVYMPALLLRDELRRKAEARKALGKVPFFKHFDASAGQTVFSADKGARIVAVYSAGFIQREGATKHYTFSDDGFQQSAVFGTGQSVNTWVSLMCVRA